MLVVLICPNCGASMEIDQNRQFAFCSYCGTKVMNTNSRVEVDHSAEIENLLYRAREFMRQQDFPRAREYCSRILDLDPRNQDARIIERQIPAERVVYHPVYRAPINNIYIQYYSVLSRRHRLRISADMGDWTELRPGQAVEFHLPYGKHRIFFEGRKSYTREITVVDEYQPIRITYSEGKVINSIDIH
ncbi:MAG: hypothetical protein II124_02920 [Clostridia bacterium]|nr:hypothetical protein [Clostridia bacterium]MBQ4341544.1 hypothetical protein [Clostridia bacterium]